MTHRGTDRAKCILSTFLHLGGEGVYHKILELDELLLDSVEKLRKVDGSSDLLDVLKPLLEEVLLSRLTSFLSSLGCGGSNLGDSTSRLLSLSLDLAVAVNPVAERDGYFLDLTTDVGESLAKVVPNTTILNSVPRIDKCILQLNEFLLEPLDFLRNLELVT